MAILTQHADVIEIRNILLQAQNLKGLDDQQVRVLMNIHEPDLLNKLFETAKKIKNQIYGNRLVLFAPLYISNACSNDCAYCAFRESNKNISRKTLTQEEISKETEALINQGQKRILLESGEENTETSIDYLLKSIETIYQTKNKRGEIRRINVNVAPLTVEEFKLLKQAKIGTYQLFQETYDRKIYQEVHTKGKKQDYDWHFSAMDRAMQAGIDDVGLGVLFGLAPWQSELLALLQHAKYLEKTYGIGPHTISVPRLEPANGSYLSSHPVHAVSDQDFLKIIAILRLAVPYTGIILSTRESAEIRRKALALGVSQISAGSRTNPGGYTEANENSGQFSVGDHRLLDEVIYDVVSLGYIPSFCTACYRLGRTGEDFMKLAKPGDIKSMCEPNAILTFYEYLCDYASEKTKQLGKELIQRELSQMSEVAKSHICLFIDQIDRGKRDIFV